MNAVARLRAMSILALAIAACDCASAGLKHAGPVISVEPGSVALEGTVGHAQEYTLNVSNTGNDVLVLDGTPTFSESDGDGADEFTIANLLESTCDDKPRAAEGRLLLAPGECARLVVRYTPAVDGKDDTELHILSNDPDQPDLAVPFTGGALTPKMEVCAFDAATQLGCSTPDALFEVDFGKVGLGVDVVRTLRIKSTGSRPVRVDALTLTGDADFVIDPATLQKELAPGESVDVKATFKATAGGSREALFEIANDDPRQSKRLVQLLAVGDAPRLCVATCDAPTAPLGVCTESTADFGRLEPGDSVTRYVIVTSCGAKALTLKKASLTAGGPAFSAQPPSLGSGTSLAPGAQLPGIPVTFKPTAEDRYTGRFDLETDTEKAFVTLAGQGKVAGCKLEAPASVIDFGQGAKLLEKRKNFAVSNRGNAQCKLPTPASITAGADVKFSIVSFPTATTLGPGQTLRFTLAYTPQDVAGPDVGELTIPFSETDAGAVPSAIRFQLRGTPAAEPACVLVAKPGPDTGTRPLDFGQVVRGTRRVMPVTFENIGSAPCRLASWQVAGGADASFFGVETPPSQLLQPGDSVLLPVWFKPDAVRAYGSVTLKVQTTDTATFPGAQCGAGATPGCAGWALAGRGVDSDLRVLPESLDFGPVTLGCRSRERKVSLYNTGRSSLVIKSFQVEPAPPPEVFKAIAPPVPLTLAAGAQASVTIRFRPPSEGVHVGALLIEPQSGTTGPGAFLAVPLRGVGTLDAHQTDRFQQGAGAKTDVLLVMDNSGSMGEEQGFLGDNAARFLGVAQQLGTDFQIGVVTTDMTAATQKGKLQTSGSLPKITVNNPNAASNLRTIVRSLGTRGSSSEKGLDATVAALSAPNTDDPAANQGFLRPDARLSVVVVSDEEDHSNAAVDFFVDFLKNLKGPYGSSLVSLSAVVGDPAPTLNDSGRPGCTGAGGDAVTGARYIEVANRTGGKFRSICSSDWGQVAADLGLDAFNTRSGFALSRAADPATIEVRVDGQLRPNADWTFDAPGNGVVFNANRIPAPNAQVVIDYNALCQ